MKATAPVLLASVALAFACGKNGQEAPNATPAAAAPDANPAANSPAKPAVNPAAQRGAPPRTNDVFALDPSSLDLGLLEPNEEKRVDFLVKNLSPQPLKILTVKTGCTCVTLDFSKLAIASGATSPVHVRVVGVTRESRRVPVVVTTDDPKHSNAELAVFYAIVPVVGCVPMKIDFGKVKQGEKAEQTVKVTLHLPPEVEKDPVLEPFISHDLPIKITLDPVTVTPAGNNFRDLTTTLHAVLDTSKPVAAFQSELVFKPKEAKTFRLTSLPVWGEVRAGTFFEHDKLVFTGLTAGTPAMKSIRFYYSGEAPPTFAAVALTPADFTEKHEVEAAKHCIRFDVTCTPTDATLSGELRVTLAGSETPFSVALTARGK